MTCPSSTGRALKKAQALAGVSNEELAKEFGVGNVAVCRWRHKDDMKFSLVVKLANRLNLSLDEFEQLGGSMKIEKGIEVPEVSGRGAPAGCGKWQKLAKQMDVGDSIFFADDKREYTRLCRAMKNLGLKSTSRWLGDGYRVWRIE